MGQLIFSTLVKIRTYATLTVSTASVERSFSKLKMIKNKLRSFYGEKWLSDPLLLAIEQDIQTNQSEVIGRPRHGTEEDAPVKQEKDPAAFTSVHRTHVA